MADHSLRGRTNHMTYFVMLQCADPEQFKLVAMPISVKYVSLPSSHALMKPNKTQLQPKNIVLKLL